MASRNLAQEWPAVVAAILAIVAGAWALNLASDYGLRTAEPSQLLPDPTLKPFALDGVVSSVSAARVGSGRTQAVFVAFSDYGCSHCGYFARHTLPVLRREYFDSGRVVFAFRHLPLSVTPQMDYAAAVTECARRSGRFWDIHDEFFRRPRTWTTDELRAHGVAATGIDGPSLDKCTDSLGRRVVEHDIQEAAQLGLVATPVFVIGVTTDAQRVIPLEFVAGAQPLDVFRQALDRTLAEVLKRSAFRLLR
jgi:protein-disulfide isomerase